jgi:hypothetical protein
VKLDDPDLTDSALHFHFCDAENSIVVLASIGGVGVNAHDTKVFEAKPFKYVNRQGKLSRSRVNQRLALNFLAPSIRRQEAVLPISHFYWDAIYTHISFIADSALPR